MNKIEGYQKEIYKHLINYTVSMKKKLPNFQEFSAFSIRYLLPLISTLTMTYPYNDVYDKINNEKSSKINHNDLKYTHGSEGLKSVMNKEEINVEFGGAYNTGDKKQDVSSYFQYEYKKETLKKYGRIFKEPQLSQYSKKISKICQCVKNSKGIVLIYSNYICLLYTSDAADE